MSQDDGSLFSFLDELNEEATKTTWVDAGTVAQIKAADIRKIRVRGLPVGVLALDDGTLVARELSCKHQGADLSAGPRRGTVVVCPRHAWEFDLATGKCLTYDTADLRSYAVKVENGRVYVADKPA